MLFVWHSYWPMVCLCLWIVTSLQVTIDACPVKTVNWLIEGTQPVPDLDKGTSSQLIAYTVGTRYVICKNHEILRMIANLSKIHTQ